jgi:hypothetical protein
MKFEGDVAAFEAACLDEIRESLERYDPRGLSPFRTLVGVELEGTYPDTAVVVTLPLQTRVQVDTRRPAHRLPHLGEPVLHAVRTVQGRDVERGWRAGGVPLVHRA